MRLLSLAAGVGGLDLGIAAETVAYSEINAAALKTLRHNYPDAAEVGDFTQLDTFDHWEPDVIAAGLPCQPASTLNVSRSGDKDERWLFDDMAEILGRGHRRPSLILENVAAIRSYPAAIARFTTAIEALGYETRTTIYKASEVGAPHRRARWWMLALHPDGTEPVPESFPTPEEVSGKTLPTPTAGASSSAYNHPSETHLHLSTGGLIIREKLLPTPLTKSGEATSGAGREALGPGCLLPTPVQNSDRRRGGKFDGATGLPENLLPTPVKHHHESAKAARNQRSRYRLHNGLADADGNIDPATGWGPFQPVINRWTLILGRPPPTRVTRNDRKDMLNAELVEWMMGYPRGWVTNHATRAQAFKLIGNGVVPHQAAGAIRKLLATPTLFGL